MTRALLLPGLTDESRPALRRSPEGLRSWYASSHGVRVEVYSGSQGCWLMLAPVHQDTRGVESLQRVLARYRTMVGSLGMQSPRVKRYDLRAVRLVVAVPEFARAYGQPTTYVVEAVGEPAALRELREVPVGTAEIAPLRPRRPTPKKKKRGNRNGK